MNKVKELGESLMLNLSDEQSKNINDAILWISSKLEKINFVNTDNVKATNYPIDIGSGKLRNDKIEKTTNKEIIKNANNKEGEYIIIK
ncbi:MAG: hypothetical protein LBS95_02910 [Mycoplasmataceae bacterium]|jgi:aspartyl/glutamyl-tRNA(Asn/Gln) amidotransferase C subunit|nr:hypothetical protein [Mycoplasmataceae bacterium]